MKDYKREDFCNEDEPNAFAIEPEVSAEFYRESLGRFDYNSESSHIYELIGVHKMSENDRMDCLDIIEEEYAEKFPIWSDEHLSWGVHFVLFGEYGFLYNSKRNIKYKMLNCPLFNKIRKNEFFSRDISGRASFSWSGERIRYWSKGDFVSLKDELLTNNEDVEWVPIEFRCNNVVDSRILGYYQWIILAVKEWVKFKKTSSSLREAVAEGIGGCYGDDIEDGNISIDNLSWHSASREDMRAIRYNIKLIFKLLEDKGLVNSKDALREYLKERGVRYI